MGCGKRVFIDTNELPILVSENHIEADLVSPCLACSSWVRKKQVFPWAAPMV